MLAVASNILQCLFKIKNKQLTMFKSLSTANKDFFALQKNTCCKASFANIVLQST